LGDMRSQREATDHGIRKKIGVRNDLGPTRKLAGRPGFEPG
jgi:hypothetical protein